MPRICVVLTFLCWLGLVSEAFLPAEHLKSQNRGRESTFPVPLLNPAPQHEGTKKKPDLLPVTQDNEQRRDAPPGAAVQVKVRLGSCCGGGGRLFDVFHLDFTLLLSAFFALHPCNPTSAPSRPSPSLPVIYRPRPPTLIENKINCKDFLSLFFFRVCLEISPHKELREDNQSLFLLFFKLFIEFCNLF